MSRYDANTAITKANRLAYEESYGPPQPSKSSSKEVSAKQTARTSTTRSTGRRKSESESKS